MLEFNANRLQESIIVIDLENHVKIKEISFDHICDSEKACRVDIYAINGEETKIIDSMCIEATELSINREYNGKAVRSLVIRLTTEQGNMTLKNLDIKRVRKQYAIMDG